MNSDHLAREEAYFPSEPELPVSFPFSDGQGADGSPQSPEALGDSSGIKLAEFIASTFIPEHVEQKETSGKTHYHSMLKHILRPETVDRLFGLSAHETKSRLKSVPNWPYLDDLPVGQVTEVHVRTLMSAALSQGYSAQTVKHIRNVLGSVLGHAKKKGLFPGENPARLIHLEQQQRRQELPNLTIAQAKAMLRVMQSPEREIALMTMTTGIGISEICGLQWKHVNLSRVSVNLGTTVVPPASILVMQHWNPAGIVPLAKNRTRVIQIPEPLALALLNLKEMAGEPGPDAFVLATATGEALRPPSVRVMRLKPVGRQLGMPRISWQALTRAHLSLLFEMRTQLSRDLVSSVQ